MFLCLGEDVANFVCGALAGIFLVMEEKRGGGERRAVGPYGVCGGEMGVEAESVLLEGGAQGGNLGGGEEQAVDADCGTFDKMP